MFTPNERLEVIEHFIEQWRPARSGATGEREVYLILKEIAADIRARTADKASGAAGKIDRAICYAAVNKDERGYRPGHLREIAELTIGYWPTIKAALDLYEKEVGK